MDLTAKILYLDLFRGKRGGQMDQWAKLRETIEARSMPCPVTGCWLWYEGAAVKGGTARDERGLRATNKSGVTGVSWSQKPGHVGKWYATITVDSRMIALGRFDDIDDAIEARRAAEAKYRRAA